MKGGSLESGGSKRIGVSCSRDWAIDSVKLNGGTIASTGRTKASVR